MSSINASSSAARSLVDRQTVTPPSKVITFQASCKDLPEGAPFLLLFFTHLFLSTDKKGRPNSFQLICCIPSGRPSPKWRIASSSEIVQNNLSPTFTKTMSFRVSSGLPFVLILLSYVSV
jgi:hypothetical protein